MNYLIQEKFRICSKIEVFKELDNISISISILNQFGETVTYAYYSNGKIY